MGYKSFIKLTLFFFIPFCPSLVSSGTALLGSLRALGRARWALVFSCQKGDYQQIVDQAKETSDLPNQSLTLD